MKIALVHDLLLKLGGGEKVLKVLSEMFEDAPIYTLLYDEEKVGGVFDKRRIRTSGLQKLPEFIKKRKKYLFPFMPAEIEKFDFSEYDLVISSSSAYAHGIITNVETKHICYCHSPMRYAWDWFHNYLDEQKLGKIRRTAISYLLHKVRIWDKIASNRVDLYLANSKHSSKRIKKYYRMDSEILYPPVDLSNYNLSLEEDDDYYLIVSTLAPYKRIELAVKLFNENGKKLIIVGEGQAKDDLVNLAKDNIEFKGFLDNDQLYDYYEKCRAFIFPGEEDFGIAPVEAMACGKPVFAYGLGGLRESVIEGKCGEFFYKTDLESMSEDFEKFDKKIDSYDKEFISNHANQFSTENFKENLKKFINSVIKS